MYRNEDWDERESRRGYGGNGRDRDEYGRFTSGRGGGRYEEDERGYGNRGSQYRERDEQGRFTSGGSERGGYGQDYHRGFGHGYEHGYAHGSQARGSWQEDRDTRGGGYERQGYGRGQERERDERGRFVPEHEEREYGRRGQSQSGGRGFAGMDPERQREIARMGGLASHESGHAHEWDSEEARRAGHMSHRGY